MRPEKENKGTKDKIIRDIKNIFKNEEEKNDYKPVRISRFWSNNYIQYKSSSDINKRISDEEYLNKIQSCIKDIINNLKESDMWKTQLTTAINFIISIDNHEYNYFKFLYSMNITYNYFIDKPMFQNIIQIMKKKVFI